MTVLSDPPYDRGTVARALASGLVNDRALDASLAMALGHRVALGQARFTGETTYAITWAQPHPSAGMSEPCPAFSESLDAAVGLLVPSLPGWTLSRLGQGDDGTWTAVLREAASGREASASSPGDVSPARCVVAAVMDAREPAPAPSS